MFGKKKKNAENDQMSSGTRREVDELLAQAQADRELSMDALAGVAGGVITPEAKKYFDDTLPLLMGTDVTYEACLSKLPQALAFIQTKYPEVTESDLIGYLKTAYKITD